MPQIFQLRLIIICILPAAVLIMQMIINRMKVFCHVAFKTSSDRGNIRKITISQKGLFYGVFAFGLMRLKMGMVFLSVSMMRINFRGLVMHTLILTR